MRIVWLAFAGMAMGLSLSGCGGFSKGEQAVEQREIKAQVGGSWASGCVKGFTEPTNYLRFVYSFLPGSAFRQERHAYADAGCTSLLATRTIEGSYGLGSVAEQEPAAHLINFVVGGARYTPQVVDGANLLNQLSACGKSDWKAGAQQDVLGETCFGESVEDGSVIYDLLETQDNNLYVGSPLKLVLNEADRPTKIDKNVAFSKQ